MSKIIYPEESGVFITVDKPVNDAINGLDDALNNCAMSIPSSFSYVNYLKSLPSVISDYKKMANEILVMAKNIDNNFKFAFEDIDSNQATLNFDTLETRDRLVK